MANPRFFKPLILDECCDSVYILKRFFKKYILGKTDVTVGTYFHMVHAYGPDSCEIKYENVATEAEEASTRTEEKFVTLNVTSDNIKRSRIVEGKTIYIDNDAGAKWFVELAVHCNNVNANQTTVLQLFWENTTVPVLKLSTYNLL